MGGQETLEDMDMENRDPNELNSHIKVNINRESYTSDHLIWILWNEPSASFRNFVWNDYEY